MIQTKGHGVKLQKISGAGRIRLSVRITIAMESGEYQVTSLALLEDRNNSTSRI